MKSRLSSTVFMVALLEASLGVVRLWGATDKEPVYENRPMSHWLKALAADDPSLSGKATDALRMIGAPAVPALVDIVKDEKAKTNARAAAMAALAYIWPDGQVAAPVLLELTRDTRTDLRLEAALALSRLDPTSTDTVVTVLAAMLEQEKGVARRAAHALGSLGARARDAVPALAKALQHDDVDVRLLAAFALGRIGPDAKDAIPALTELAQDERETKALRDNAATSLRAIRGEIQLQPH